MTITTTEYAAVSGSPKRFGTRHFDDAGTPVVQTWYPGFRPRYVCVENITDSIKYEWYEGMATTDCIKTVLNGTRSLLTTSKLVVTTAAGSRPSILLAASEILQNKQYYVMGTN